MERSIEQLQTKIKDIENKIKKILIDMARYKHGHYHTTKGLEKNILREKRKEKLETELDLLQKQLVKKLSDGNVIEEDTETKKITNEKTPRKIVRHEKIKDKVQSHYIKNYKIIEKQHSPNLWDTSPNGIKPYFTRAKFTSLQIIMLYNYLQGTFFDGNTSLADFAYILNGKGKSYDEPLEWHGTAASLAYFLGKLLNRFYDVKNKEMWKIAAVCFYQQKNIFQAYKNINGQPRSSQKINEMVNMMEEIA